MWQPNTRQWWVIWIAVAIALFFATMSDFGVIGFGAPILIGLLLVWQLEGHRGKQDNGTRNNPNNS
jgi:hypothetical protein